MPNSEAMPRIGVSAAIFNKNQQVLLVRRANPPAQGQWHLPGGKQEAGESMLEAVQREVAEETGIYPIEIEQLIAVVERRLDGFHYIILDFLAGLTNNSVTTPVAADDASAARWVNMQDLSSLDLADGLLPILLKAQHMHSVSSTSLGLFDLTGQGSDFLPR